MTETEDDGFYPGSTAVRRSLGGEAPVLPEQPPEPWEELGKRYLNAAGKVQVFYPISALALALRRSPITIRHWDEMGYLPKGGRSGSRSKMGRRRMYTREQIVGLQSIAREEGLFNGRRVYVGETRFEKKAAALFRELAEQ